jgi:hypothetical protein
MPRPRQDKMEVVKYATQCSLISAMTLFVPELYIPERVPEKYVKLTASWGIDHSVLERQTYWDTTSRDGKIRGCNIMTPFY